MPRPFTLFTGQWAGLPLEEVCQHAREWGYDGLELACWGDPRRGWDFVSAGRGDIRWEDIFRMLNSIGYRGPISIEWEDAGMDRLAGAAEAITFLRRFDFDPPQASFDAAFSTGRD